MNRTEDAPTCPMCRTAPELITGSCPECNYLAPYRSSSSQVETAELCLRKWFLDKVVGLPRTTNAAAEYGTVTHTHLEHWFTSATPPSMTREGRTALAILRCLPPPQTPGIEVEHEIKINVGGVPFVGYIDLRIIDQEVPFISDHKTTSDLKWAKTPTELATSAQPALYTAATFEETARLATEGKRRAPASLVNLQWTYGTRHKSPRVLPVKAALTQADIAPRMRETADTAHVLKELWEARPAWADVPYDAQGCEAFGGCPFRSTCNLTPIEKLGSIMTQQSKSDAFKAKLLAAKAAKANGAATVPATSGTVNPPEAPTEAAASPEPEPAKPPKKPRKSRKKKAPEPAADVAAKSIEPAPLADRVAQAAPPIDMLTQQYAAGFRDGFELAGKLIK